MGAIQAAVTALAAAVKVMPGSQAIRAAHDKPPNQVTPYPMAVCFCGESTTQRASLGGAVSYEATLVCEIHMPRKDIARAVTVLMSYWELLAELPGSNPTLTGTVTGMRSIRQGLSAEEWTGEETTCLRASLDVVIE